MTLKQLTVLVNASCERGGNFSRGLSILSVKWPFRRLGSLRKSAVVAMQAKEAAQAEENDLAQAVTEAASEDEEEFEEGGDDGDDNAHGQAPEQHFDGQDEDGDV